jgi:hypothetical protein
MLKLLVYCESIVIICFFRSQWPHGRRCVSTTARVLGLQVRISPAPWMSVCCECCVLSGIGFCVGLITQRSPAECDVFECDREALITRGSRSTRGCYSMENNYTFSLTSLLLFIVMAAYNDCLLDGGYRSLCTVITGLMIA